MIKRHPPVVTLSEERIFLIRGHRVLLDADLAQVYGVTTARLNQQVRRNIDRFPEDFAFRLTNQEGAALMLQIATSRIGRGGRRKPPFVFTEHGALMAASVLNTPVAVDASIQVVRAFVRLRQMLASQSQFSRKLAALENKLTEHDRKLTIVFDAVRQLMEPPPPVNKRKRIGF